MDIKKKDSIYEIISKERHYLTTINNVDSLDIEEYNSEVIVKDKKLFNSVLEAFKIENLKVLVIMENEELLNEFINYII